MTNIYRGLSGRSWKFWLAATFPFTKQHNRSIGSTASGSNIKLKTQEAILVGKFCKFTGPKENKLYITCDIRYQPVLIATGRLSLVRVKREHG
jgi:hypothetical protein